MEIRKAVITSAGKATRMQPISNVIPKGLLPIFKKLNGKRQSVPIVDIIIESLKGAGASRLCFVMGTKSRLLIDYLFGKDVTFVFQDVPKGFGDAVLRAEEFVVPDPFFLHVDDIFITSGYKEAAEIFKELDTDCLLFLSKVKDPKLYGVVEATFHKNMSSHKVFKINGVEEKPKEPKSDLAVCGIYIFSSKIFTKLKELDSDTEIQLTDAIQKLANEGRAYGMLLEEEAWLDLGNPESYFNTLSYSYNNL